MIHHNLKVITFFTLLGLTLTSTAIAGFNIDDFAKSLDGAIQEVERSINTNDSAPSPENSRSSSSSKLSKSGHSAVKKSKGGKISLETLMSFDIKGIKLGDPIQVVKNIFPSGELIHTFNEAGGIIIYESINGSKNENNYKKISVWATKFDNKIYKIIYDQYLGPLSSTDAVKRQLINKYGAYSHYSKEYNRLSWSTKHRHNGVLGFNSLKAGFRKRNEIYILRMVLESEHLLRKVIIKGKEIEKAKQKSKAVRQADF